MTRVGFTGTRQGMDDHQADQLRVLLKMFVDLAVAGSVLEFHHGACLGSDEQAALMARALGYHVVAHPGRPMTGPQEYTSKPSIDASNEVLAAQPYLVRNKRIVQATDVLIATPGQANERLRSGTWSTVRYAWSRPSPVIVVTPL